MELSRTRRIVGAGLSGKGVLRVVVVVGSVVVKVVDLLVVVVAVGAVVVLKVSATVASTGSRMVSAPPSSDSPCVRWWSVFKDCSEMKKKTRNQTKKMIIM